MRISLLQSALIWEDREANLLGFEQKLSDLIGKTDIAILPEMFPTGFSMNAQKVSTPSGGPVEQWMLAQAAKLNACVAGSHAVKEKNGFVNRFTWAFPDGSLKFYNKRHLFTLAKEDEAYQSGTEKVIIEWRGWKICPLVCYDLRFPVWSRNVEQYDLLIYTANWPKPRIKHWDRLLPARAVENQCFVAATNIVGKDGNGLEYVGHSQVLDYEGTLLAFEENTDTVITVELDKKPMLRFREKLNFLADQDGFTIHSNT